MRDAAMQDRGMSSVGFHLAEDESLLLSKLIKMASDQDRSGILNI